jgi:hypothetical protein
MVGASTLAPRTSGSAVVRATHGDVPRDRSARIGDAAAVTGACHVPSDSLTGIGATLRRFLEANRAHYREAPQVVSGEGCRLLAGNHVDGVPLPDGRIPRAADAACDKVAATQSAGPATMVTGSDVEPDRPPFVRYFAPTVTAPRPLGVHVTMATRLTSGTDALIGWPLRLKPTDPCTLFRMTVAVRTTANP